MRKFALAVCLLVGAALVLAAVAPSALAAPVRTVKPTTSTATSTTVASASGYKLTYTPTRQITGTYTANWQCTGQTVTGWTYYELMPPTGGRQTITMTLTPNGQKATTQGNMHRPLLYSRTTSANQGTFTVTYKGTLNEVKLVALRPGEAAPRVPAMSASDQKYWTEATDALDYSSSIVSSWLDSAGLHRQSGESDLALGRRIFLAMRATFKYNLSHGPQQRASDVVRDKVTVCGGLGWVFAAAMRANGVPARAISLLKCDQNYNVGGSDLGHCNNEFYCQGIGWVPADLTGGVCASSDQEALGYFAHDDAGFLVTFDGGDDFSVDMTLLGKQVNRGANTSSDVINSRIPWGVNADGGTGGSLKCTDTWVTQVTVKTPPAPAIDPSGQPPASIANGQAGYLVWHDASGWHVHSATDGQTHGWGIEIDADATPKSQAVPTGKHTISKAVASKTLYAVGIENADGLNADVKVRAGVKSLRFLLSLESANAPADHIWIGSKGAHPQDGIFVLPNGAVTTGAKPLHVTSGTTGTTNTNNTNTTSTTSTAGNTSGGGSGLRVIKH